MEKRNDQRILIIDAGGRGGALGWKLQQSPRISQLFFAPGTPQTAKFGQNVPISMTDIQGLRNFALENHIDLTVVGPELPLFAGIVDEFERHGLRIVGPRKEVALLEESKDFTKHVMGRCGIATAKHKTCTSHAEALAYIQDTTLTYPLYIKANGPAGGRGAIKCLSLQEAEIVLKRLMIDKEFGPGGEKVVIEEFIDGPEVSAHGVCAGRKFTVFPFAKDYKMSHDGNTGENCGGMGGFAPVPTTDIFKLEVENDVFKILLKALEYWGIPYYGLLFPGLKMTSRGPKVLEFNVRPGDSETQIFMKLLESDLLDLLEMGSDKTGMIKDVDVRWRPGSVVCVVMASEGYPKPTERGQGVPIYGIAEAEKIEGVTVFHAGTTLKEGHGSQLFTAGGRVLNVTAYAPTRELAIERAYQAVSRIHFKGKRYRTDIGQDIV